MECKKTHGMNDRRHVFIKAWQANAVNSFTITKETLVGPKQIFVHVGLTSVCY
jgi:hypothetical protein